MRFAYYFFSFFRVDKATKQKRTLEWKREKERKRVERLYNDYNYCMLECGNCGFKWPRYIPNSPNYTADMHGKKYISFNRCPCCITLKNVKIVSITPCSEMDTLPDLIIER